jgi:hypothetical protein
MVMIVAAIPGQTAFGVALIGSVAAYGPVPSPVGSWSPTCSPPPLQPSHPHLVGSAPWKLHS